MYKQAKFNQIKASSFKPPLGQVAAVSFEVLLSCRSQREMNSKGTMSWAHSYLCTADTRESPNKLPVSSSPSAFLDLSIFEV